MTLHPLVQAVYDAERRYHVATTSAESVSAVRDFNQANRALSREAQKAARYTAGLKEKKQ